jgi:hypothetical protein
MFRRCPPKSSVTLKDKLWDAAQNGDLLKFNELIESIGIEDINEYHKERGITLLHAVVCGDVYYIEGQFEEITSILLKRGASLLIPAKEGSQLPPGIAVGDSPLDVARKYSYASRGHSHVFDGFRVLPVFLNHLGIVPPKKSWFYTMSYIAKSVPVIFGELWNNKENAEAALDALRVPSYIPPISNETLKEAVEYCVKKDELPSYVAQQVIGMLMQLPESERKTLVDSCRPKISECLSAEFDMISPEEQSMIYRKSLITGLFVGLLVFLAISYKKDTLSIGILVALCSSVLSACFTGGQLNSAAIKIQNEKRHSQNKRADSLLSQSLFNTRRAIDGNQPASPHSQCSVSLLKHDQTINAAKKLLSARQDPSRSYSPFRPEESTYPQDGCQIL